MGRRNQGDGGSFATGMTQDVEDAEFVVEGEIPAETRRLRVYADSGDFIIDIPEGARATFGYFNPASAGQSSSPYGRGYGDGGMSEMRRTALRIYGKGGEKNQLAVFCGVKGFRDEGAVKLTRINERVTLTTTYDDDGRGKIERAAVEDRKLIAERESEIPF